ncbi:MAG: GntR family transcriptional regulator [Alphaproteobacteria bacterium]
MLTADKARVPERSLSEIILAALDGEIISGALKPRERLVETALAARFGASRAPVREALRALQREGLVSNGPRGLQVADVSREEAGEIFEVLADLEELYTRRAVPRISLSDVAEMSRLLKRMERSAAQGDVQRYFELNDAFHAVISNACPNRTLIQLLASLGKRTPRFRRLAMSLPGRLEKSIEEHRRILDAVRQGDAEAAGRRARESAERAYRALNAFLENSSPFV